MGHSHTQQSTAKCNGPLRFRNRDRKVSIALEGILLRNRKVDCSQCDQ